MSDRIYVDNPSLSRSEMGGLWAYALEIEALSVHKVKLYDILNVEKIKRKSIDLKCVKNNAK